MPNVQDRDALYYPYIHIRDHQINWLKATLLCFPQVRRIVPGDFHLNDPEAVAPFRNVKGARGEPLLGEEYTDYHFDSSPVAAAQHKLLAMMNDNPALMAKRYSQASTRHELGGKADSFEMHAGKMLAPLHDHLLSHDLGWYSRRTRSDNADNRWVTLHPTLGEAIMSLIAIAIARDAKLDIVTSSSEMHHALAVQDINEVLDLLLGRYSERKDASVDEKVDELAEVVMTTFFDLDKLTAAQIAELQKEGKDLRAFKNSLVPFAEELTDPADPARRAKLLHDKAQEVIARWREHRKSLPSFAQDALVDAAGVSLPALGVSAVAGANPIVAVAGAGLAVAYVTFKGRKILRDYRKNIGSPLNYLTRIEKAGASLVLPPVAGMSDDSIFQIPS
jgi:hypothetical protein